MKFIEVTIGKDEKIILNAAAIMAVFKIDIGSRLLLAKDVHLHPMLANNNQVVRESYDQIMKVLEVTKCE